MTESLFAPLTPFLISVNNIQSKIFHLSAEESCTFPQLLSEPTIGPINFIATSIINFILFTFIDALKNICGDNLHNLYASRRIDRENLVQGL